MGLTACHLMSAWFRQRRECDEAVPSHSKRVHVVASAPYLRDLRVVVIDRRLREPAPWIKKTIHQSGLNTVWLEPDPDSTSNAHPVSLTTTEVGTLLRGVRSWERRNALHRLFAGQADKTRTFRDDEIALLAPPLSKALGQTSPSERIYFHLSHPTDQGNEETTTGWVSVRGSILYLSLSEAHDQHGPGPDISKYDRQMPNVPQVSTAFRYHLRA